MGNKEMPYAISPAVVHLDEVQIKWAIDAAVSAYGFAVGEVTLDYAGGPGRGSFLARVEVTPMEVVAPDGTASRLLLAASVAGSEQRAALLREAAGAMAEGGSR